MTGLRSKRPRVRLDPESYQRLRQSVLQRDQWRCQSCGSIAGLEVHHIEPRGQLGGDVAEEFDHALLGLYHRNTHMHEL